MKFNLPFYQTIKSVKSIICIFDLVTGNLPVDLI